MCITLLVSTKENISLGFQVKKIDSFGLINDVLIEDWNNGGHTLLIIHEPLFSAATSAFLIKCIF